MPLSFPARLLRLRIAPAYLGMNKNVFNKQVRPCVRVNAVELRSLLNAANRLKKCRKSPAMTVLRLTG
jgi:hypothetical protein